MDAPTASAPNRSLAVPPDAETITSTDPSPQGVAVATRVTRPPALSTAVTVPAPSSRIRPS